MKNKLVTCLIILSALLTGCSNQEENEWIADENIDMSDELLMSDESVLTDMPEYSKMRGGESEVIDRSFENAPPLIPHRVGGFLPIKVDDNKCLLCHLPEKAKEFKATAMPKTHFTSYRPKVVEEDGRYRVDASHDENEVVETDLDHFNGAMFNCSQCHVPQSNASLDVENLFAPDYRKSSEKKESNLKDKMDEGVR